MKMFAVVLLALVGLSSADFHDPNCGGKGVIVHLFEWKWTDIAKECERYLGPKGFCGVQVSPPNEHTVINKDNDRPWWERYQPVSYKLVSRSGNEDQFKDMVQRCNKVGVKIYVDGVLNHMAGLGRSGTGSAGSSFNSDNRDFPGVPFSRGDFHTCPGDCNSHSCNIESYNDKQQVKNCMLVGLTDLNGGKDHVKQMQAGYLNHLVSIGVAGFRLDASKHMWVGDLKGILNMVNGKPFFYHEVHDMGGEPVKCSDYFELGYVTEFRYCQMVKQGVDDLDKLKNVYNKGWGMSPPNQALVFVDNHDTQRDGSTLTYRDGARYKRAVAFTLAYNYGFTRIMSGYNFNGHDQGPPHNGDFSTKDVTINSDGSCGNGWTCEHRWKAIGNMARFRNAVLKTDKVDNWTYNNGMLSFSRGGLGFFAMGLNNFNEKRQTGMPAGSYCDLISNCKIKISVDGSGNAQVAPAEGNDPFVAIIKDQYYNSTVPY